MDTWEYRILEVSVETRVSLEIDLLNGEGRYGWEVFNVQTTLPIAYEDRISRRKYYMKRKRLDNGLVA